MLECAGIKESDKDKVAKSMDFTMKNTNDTQENNAKNNTYPIITKRYSKNIWRKYIKCVEEYRLLKDGDIVFVPINTKIYNFANEYLGKMLLTMSREFKMYDIEVIVGEDFSVIDKYNCNKVVAPDSFEDIADNTLWEMLYNGRISSHLPKEQIKGDYTIIRPLYLIHREDILMCHKDILPVINEKNTCNSQEVVSDTMKHKELFYVRSIIDRLSCNNEAVGNNVFGSVVNVDADMLPAYWLDGKKHSFLDEYDCKNRSCK